MGLRCCWHGFQGKEAWGRCSIGTIETLHIGTVPLAVFLRLALALGLRCCGTAPKGKRHGAGEATAPYKRSTVGHGVAGSVPEVGVGTGATVPLAMPSSERWHGAATVPLAVRVPSLGIACRTDDLLAERATLGAILLDREAIVAVAAWLTPDHFYLEQHALVYEAMLACRHRREPPDLMTVRAELRRHERFDLVGGFAALGDLLNEVPTAVHIAYYARNVERTAILRRLIEAGGKIAAAGYDDSQELAMTLDHAERTLFAVSQRRGDQDWRHLGQVANEWFTELEQANGASPGLPPATLTSTC